MQKENTLYDDFANSDAGKSSAISATMHFSRGNPFMSPRSTTCLNLNNSYSTLFRNYGSQSLSDAVPFDGALASAGRQVSSSSSIMEFQQLYNRYTLCIGQLQDSIEEVDALRRENDSLRICNTDLGRRLSLLTSRDRLFSDLNCLNISSPVAISPAASIPTPPPHIEHNRIEQRSTERVSLPKSIAVRSSGYLKMNRPGQETTRQKSVGQSSPESVSLLCLQFAFRLIIPRDIPSPFSHRYWSFPLLVFIGSVISLPNLRNIKTYTHKECYKLISLCK